MRARLVCVGLVGLMAMLAAARAHADWRAGPVLDSSKPPNDVLDVWGVGTYAVGYDDDNNTRGGAYVVVDGGTVRAFPVPMANTVSVGTFYQPVQQCFVLMASDGRRSTLGPDDAGCGLISPNQPITYAGFESGETFRRVKHAPGGGATVVVGTDETQKVLVSDAGIHVPGVGFAVVWRDGRGPLEPPPYAVTRVDGGVHFFVATSSAANSPRALRGSIDPKAEAEWSYNDSSLGFLQDVALFAADGRAQPLVVLGTRNALLQGDPSSPTGTPGAVRVVAELPPAQQLVGLSMNVGDGSDAGEGFGMALVQTPGGDLRVLSPVPAGSQTDAGTVWRERVLPPDAGRQMADVSQVACHGAAYCVLTAPGKTSDNLFLYSNDAKPVLSVDGGPDVRVAAGSVELDEDSSATLSLGATDNDGDPVRVTAGFTDLVQDTNVWSVGTSSMLPGEPVRVPVTTKQVCKLTPVGLFQVQASDGWREHDLREDVEVYVQHTRRPSPPDVRRVDGGLVPPGDASLVELSAGDPELVLTSTEPNTNTHCQWVDRQWSQTPPNGPRLEQLDAGTTVRIRPPTTFCEAGGRDFALTLDSKDEGNITVSRTFTVRLRPWGAPEPVFAASTAAFLQEPPIGAPVTVQPDPLRHACQSAPGFPGVVTSWSVTRSNGGVPGNDYRIQTLLGDGGPDLQTFPVETAGLVLRATGCQAQSVLTVRAAHRVASTDGGPLPFGPESQRQVQVPPGWTELSQGMIQVTGRPGVLGLDSGLDCAAQRGLGAVLWLSSDASGETTPRQTVSLPVDWPLPRDVECGSYTLHAVLKDSSGEGREQTPSTLELPGAGVRLEALAPEVEVKAECGRGASVALSDLVRPVAGFCQAPDYTLTGLGDAGLERISPSGEPVQLATVSRELDELIGHKATVTVKASKGGEQTEQAATVRITTEPFVRVERRTELPAAGETGLVGVLVRLTNTTACDVSGVDYEERLEGLSFVKESAHLDGETVDAGDADDRLTLVLPRLEAGATRTLSYVARPHLLGERRMEGTAKKNSVLLSISDTSEPPREGCGCTSAGSAPMLLVLALLGALSRRRPTTRS